MLDWRKFEGETPSLDMTVVVATRVDERNWHGEVYSLLHTSEGFCWENLDGDRMCDGDDWMDLASDAGWTHWAYIELPEAP